VLRKLSIRNYQSLRSVDLDLRGFTVIVGPSGSGKSSLVRASKMLVVNARGSAYVSRGQKRAGVVGEMVDGAIVALERGEGHGLYRMIANGEEKRYTKLGGATPDEIAECFRVDPDLTFAGQFDQPYLLADSGGQVARALGELTNVTVIFEAVREANRRRQATNVQLRSRKADLQRATDELQNYRRLPRQLQAMSKAEEVLERAKSLQVDVDKLRRALQTYELAERVLEKADAAVGRPLPILEPLEKLLARRAELADKLKSIAHLQNMYAVAVAGIEIATKQEEQAHRELHSTLVAAGVCPTCGADTSGLE